MSTRAVTIRPSFKHTKLIYSTVEKWEKDLRLKIPGLLDCRSRHIKIQLGFRTNSSGLCLPFGLSVDRLPLKTDMLKNACMHVVRA